MQLFTGEHAAVLNIVEKLGRLAGKKSGVFSLPLSSRRRKEQSGRSVCSK